MKPLNRKERTELKALNRRIQTQKATGRELLRAIDLTKRDHAEAISRNVDTTLRTYWVEVLLDDGATHGVPVDGYQDDLDRVKQDAMDNAKEWGLRPVEIDSITEEE